MNYGGIKKVFMETIMLMALCRFPTKQCCKSQKMLHFIFYYRSFARTDSILVINTTFKVTNDGLYKLVEKIRESSQICGIWRLLVITFSS